MKYTLSFLLTLLMLFSVVLSSCSDENGTASVIDDSSDIQEDNNSSAVTENTSSQPETSQDSEDSNASQTLIYEIPETVIYNTLETVEKETYEMYPFAEKDDGNMEYAFRYSNPEGESDISNLEKLVQEHSGDDDTWFYVAFNINGFYRVHEFVYQNGMGHHNIPTDETRIKDAKRGMEYLLTLGMIPDYEHPWSYTQWQEGETVCFAAVGYMTADMLLSIDDPEYQYRVLHLTAPEEFESVFGEYEFFGDLISY